MPLYEYRCQDCRRRSTILVRSINNPTGAACDHCGSSNMNRLISKFSFRRSWGSSLDWAPDTGYPENIDNEDPREVAGWMRRMQQEMGGEVTPEFDAMVDELESEGGFDDGGDDLDG